MEVIETGMGDLFCLPDPEGVRAFMRENKKMELRDKLMSHQEAVSKFVKPHDYLGVELYGSVRCPLSVVREIVRQKITDLSFVGQSVLEADLLLAGNCVTKMDITYIGWEVFGTSPILRRAVESGEVKTVEWSNAALSWRLIAGAMGIPFIPTRSMLGTETLKYSAAKVVKDPFTGNKICLLPATVIDVGLIHVHKADKFGNCEIEGITGFAPEMARASKKLIITAEEIVDTEYFRQNPDRNTIPYFLTDALIHAPYSAHPGETNYCYWRDEKHLKMYFDMAKTVEGMQEYLDKFIYGVKSHEEYLELIGQETLNEMKSKAKGR